MNVHSFHLGWVCGVSLWKNKKTIKDKIKMIYMYVYSFHLGCGVSVGKNKKKIKNKDK